MPEIVMALNAGDRLRYDVTALVGEGGMGQVCQAKKITLKAGTSGWRALHD